jgi:hypothetical protein
LLPTIQIYARETMALHPIDDGFPEWSHAPWVNISLPLSYPVNPLTPLRGTGSLTAANLVPSSPYCAGGRLCRCIRVRSHERNSDRLLRFEFTQHPPKRSFSQALIEALSTRQGSR